MTMPAASRRAPAIAAAAAAAAATGAALWWCSDRAPYPYEQHRLLDIQLPFLTRRRLDALLGVTPGLRILEVGPGTGLQALHVAAQLGPGGRLVVGEFMDPHYIPLVTLLRHAHASGLQLTARLGPPLAYYAQFRAVPSCGR
jgi:predicted O-methyltransferase YrrM